MSSSAPQQTIQAKMMPRIKPARSMALFPNPRHHTVSRPWGPRNDAPFRRHLWGRRSPERPAVLRRCVAANFGFLKRRSFAVKHSRHGDICEAPKFSKDREPSHGKGKIHGKLYRSNSLELCCCSATAALLPCFCSAAFALLPCCCSAVSARLTICAASVAIPVGIPFRIPVRFPVRVLVRISARIPVAILVRIPVALLSQYFPSRSSQNIST